MDIIFNKRFRRAARLNDQGKLLAGTYGQKILGKVNSSGHVFDKSGKKLGFVDPHGRIYDSSLRHVGTVRNDGTVVDMNARRVLKVENPHAGAAAFLLGTEQKKPAPPQVKKPEPLAEKKQFALTGSPVENKAVKLGMGTRATPSELLAEKPRVGEPGRPADKPVPPSTKPMGSGGSDTKASDSSVTGGPTAPTGGVPPAK